jgi:hypothetical protein
MTALRYWDVFISYFNNNNNNIIIIIIIIIISQPSVFLLEC